MSSFENHKVHKENNQDIQVEEKRLIDTNHDAEVKEFLKKYTNDHKNKNEDIISSMEGNEIERRCFESEKILQLINTEFNKRLELQKIVVNETFQTNTCIEHLNNADSYNKEVLQSEEEHIKSRINTIRDHLGCYCSNIGNMNAQQQDCKQQIVWFLKEIKKCKLRVNEFVTTYKELQILKSHSENLIADRREKMLKNVARFHSKLQIQEIEMNSLKASIEEKDREKEKLMTVYNTLSSKH